MKHYLNLREEPFALIKSGRKTIEMRLSDEKRKVIQIGDEIEFTNESTLEKVTAKVLNLYRFKDFEELYAYFDKSKLGYASNEVALPSDMNKYYSDERIKEFGVLGIEIKLI